MSHDVPRLSHVCLALSFQTNVTARVAAEKALAELTDAQLMLLEQIFPKHVLFHMASHAHVSSMTSAHMGVLGVMGVFIPL